MQMEPIIFEWKDGNTSLNDCGVQALNERNIITQYYMQKLEAFVYGSWHNVLYSKLYGDTYQVCFQ